MRWGYRPEFKDEGRNMAKVRTNEELVSDLPSFIVKRSQDFPSWFVVTCPREDCGQTFLVKGSAWSSKKFYKSKDKTILIRGRACPYCSKVGLAKRPR